MKFDTLLARYLYQHKKLDLPGIGTFTADDTVYLSEENDKEKPALDGIIFRNSNIAEAETTLIDFIKVHTGKMRPLAISDLESFLTLGKQFLYMGKPFHLEGIGTLTLRKDGKLDFAPGQYGVAKLDDPVVDKTESRQRTVPEKTAPEEEEAIEEEPGQPRRRKGLVLFALITGLLLAGWGIYYFFNQRASGGGTFNVMTDSATTAAKDSTQIQSGNTNDTSLISEIDVLANRLQFKFVVETTENRLRAINQFNLLKSYGNPIRMETRDSSLFRLYYIIPATSEDTLRIRDSLNRRYYGNTPSIRVTIEPN